MKQEGDRSKRGALESFDVVSVKCQSTIVSAAIKI